VVSLLNYEFPHRQALFVFDNSFSHSYFAPEALLASRMNLFPWEKK
jgi:hypothetical protein